MNDNIGLAYVGKITNIEPIENADFIVSATVICGKGGKWRGVIRECDFEIGSICAVYLPDALIPPSDDMSFLKNSNWRVRMQRFRGAPSEVVIVPLKVNFDLGTDITEILGVTKYYKPVPIHLQGKAKGDFPSFIPKTDELNYQMYGDLVEALHGHSYYITEKADGSSTTAFKYNDNFGICSRNWELEADENNGYWQVSAKYQLQDKLPEGYAIQWETCGPGIQGNPMGLKEIDGFAFSAYDIHEKKYLRMYDFMELCKEIGIPTVGFIRVSNDFDKSTVATLGEGIYLNGKQREGVVVRSQQNLLGHAPISFKVINLGYENG